VVSESETPGENLAVYYESEDGALVSTKTDDGIYIFPLVTRGSRLRPYTMFDGERCYPPQGTMVEICKNEAEIDFDLSRCRKG
jgi:hypothetical protein